MRATPMMLAAALVAAPAIGCEQDDVDDAARETGEAAETVAATGEEAAEDLGASAEATKDEFVSSAGERLKTLKARYQRLKGEAAEARGEVKADLKVLIEDIEAEMKTIESKLREAKSASGDGWRRVTGEIRESTREVERKLDKMREQIDVT